MSNSSDKSDSARRRAQTHFTASEQRDTLVRREIEKERAASNAKTAKLRALRLAKEAVDKEAADKLAAEKELEKAAKTRTRAAPRKKPSPPA
jgi:predicted negative regulator of RcsB-dependent stress response